MATAKAIAILEPCGVISDAGTGVDLRCGGGQGAALTCPRHVIHSRARSTPAEEYSKNEGRPSDGPHFWSRVRESNPPSQLGKLE